MKVKMTLTPEEIQEYKTYKDKIINARTRQEISIYKDRAQRILNIGRARYIQSLEAKKDMRVKSVLLPKFAVKGSWVVQNQAAGVAVDIPFRKSNTQQRKMTTKQ